MELFINQTIFTLVVTKDLYVGKVLVEKHKHILFVHFTVEFFLNQFLQTIKRFIHADRLLVHKNNMMVIGKRNILLFL